MPDYLLVCQVQVTGYSLGEHFGELNMRSVEPLQDPTEPRHLAAVLVRTQ